MFFPTGLVAVIIAIVSAYATYQSIMSMANIKKYESQAEKAAEWSNTARDRLWATRFTIGAGFISVSNLPCPDSIDTTNRYPPATADTTDMAHF